MNRLIIEGQEADLTQEVINIKFQINNLGDISTRKSTVSNTLRLPRTSTNEAIFGMLGMVGSGSRVPYKKLRCTYIQDNLTLIHNGYIHVTEKTDEYYMCTILDGIIDLAERLKGKTLADLPFEPIVLSMSGYLATFTNTSDYIFALGHYDKAYKIEVFDYMNWDITKQAPALFMHTLFHKILTEAGFSYDSEISDDDGFMSEVISLERGFDISAKVRELSIDGGDVYNHLYNNDPESPKIIHNLETTGTSSTVEVVGSRLNVLVGEIDLQLGFNVSVANFNTKTVFQILKNGVVIDTRDIEGRNPHMFTVVVNGLNVGDYIEVRSYGVRVIFNNNIAVSRCKVTLTADRDSGAPMIDIKAHVGESIKQIDLLKDVMQRYGLIMKVDAMNSNHLHFKRLESILNDRVNAVDLSHVFDKIISTDYRVNYAKINKAEYNYTNPDGVKSQDAFMFIDNDHIKDEGELFKSPFEISTKDIETDIFGEPIPTYDIFLWDGKKETDELEIESFVYSNLSVKNRIFRVDQWNENTRFTFFGDNSTTVTSTPILSLKGVGMEDYLFNNYPAFNYLLNDFKEIKVKMNLNTIDLLKLDFFNLIYLKELQAYFYLQQYTNNGEVTLLQINKFR